MSSELQFQIYEWNNYHESIEDDELYIIQLFGRTMDDKDVCLKVTGFMPFFYVEIPDNWKISQADKLVETLKYKVSYRSKNNPKYDYDLSNSLKEYKIVKKNKFYNFECNKKFQFLLLVFTNQNALREFSNVLRKPIKIYNLVSKEILFKRYEANIEPQLRFMHMTNITACGWLSLDKKKLIPYNEYSYCDYNYSIFWKDVNALQNINKMAPFKIMGYDIECISCDHNFPQADRETDKIIQIGITMYRYGMLNCYEQHILTLKKCLNIPEANVECYETERGLLLGFAEKIKSLRPDIRAGYNNFGFDDQYIYDRLNIIDTLEAKKNNTIVENLPNRLYTKFIINLGKLNNQFIMDNENIKESLTSFQTKFLSSSALGDNELKFFNIPGIIPLDVMKIIQKDYKLNSYKLDSVASNFITEKIIKIAKCNQDKEDYTTNIYTKSTKALEEESYIQIIIINGYASYKLKENTKYLVFKIFNLVENDTKYQVMQISLDAKQYQDLDNALNNKLFKVVWTFAKDDLHHTLINQYYNDGNAKQIRIIAKYCLKDCKLVNLLLAKLDIIVNNIGMANVCHIPIAYLFLRGQGIKIFSLVAKKCRQKNYLILTLDKVNIENEETYEGATVINPKPGVYLSPIGVLDYSSLYPSSMIERNLSHECFLPLSYEKYNNLDNYIYHKIDIIVKDENGDVVKNIDNTIKKEKHTFVQEIVTEDQIKIELGSFLEMLNKEYDNILTKINTNKYYDADLIKLRLSCINKDNKTDEDSKIENQQDFEKLKISNNDRKLLIDYINKEKEEKIKNEKNKHYNIIDNKTVRFGILPEILTELLFKRKETNLQLKFEKDEFVRSILNGLQLAYKLTANSLYGQTGAPTSSIFFKEIAASTTAIGRERLYYAKDIVEKNFENSEIIYGDSVTSDTPIIFKMDNKIYIKPIASIGDYWEPYSQFHKCDTNRKNKEQCLIDCQVWTQNRWTSVRRIIRHKSCKKIYRIMTPTSCIDVTEDHSLLDANNKILKAADADNRRLLTGFIEDLVDTDSILSGNDAFILGLYYFIKFKTLPLVIYEKYESYLDYLDLASLREKLKNYDLTFIPIELLSNVNLRKDFLRGYNMTNMDFFILKDKVNAQCLYYLLKLENYHLSLKLDEDNYIISIVSQSKDNIVFQNNIIRSTNNTEYVYDIETDYGSFHAGIGEIIVKNTDSIFINFHIKDENNKDRTDVDALLKTIELSKQASKIINSMLPRPQNIVYEKTLYPFILVSKKRYVGLLYTDNANNFEIKAMGIVLKRRDNAQIVKIIVGGLIDVILKERDIDKALKYVQSTIADLMAGKFSIDNFVITKTLKSKYKKPLTIAHKVLADRMALRDPGNKPQINDRISYVYITKETNSLKKKIVLQGELIEHIDYVIEHKLQVDFLYYLQHQIMKPTAQILELIMPTSEVEKFFNRFIVRETANRKKCPSLEKWMYGASIEDDEISRTSRNLDKKILPVYADKKIKIPLDQWFINN